MRIHKEGFAIIPIAAVLIALLYFALWWLIPFDIIDWILAGVAVIFWLLIVWFFRIPPVSIPPGEKTVVAPAEGKVVVIEKTQEEEYLKEDRIQVSIFMSPLNVHVNRSPVDGEVAYFKYHPGKYLVAWHPKSSTENERTTIVCKMKDGMEILMRQIAGAVARRIKFYEEEGNQVVRGAEVGFIRFGSRVDLFLPTEAKILIDIGDKTICGETIIAELP